MLLLGVLVIPRIDLGSTTSDLADDPAAAAAVVRSGPHQPPAGAPTSITTTVTTASRDAGPDLIVPLVAPTAEPTATATPAPTPLATPAPASTSGSGSQAGAAAAPPAPAAPPPAQTPAPAPVAGNVVTFGPSVTAGQLTAAIADNSIDVILLQPGTYSVGAMTINADRSRLVTIRSQTPGTVVFAGNGAGHAFGLGFGGRTSNIAFLNLIFDGYVIGERGVFTLGNAHNITMSGITIRNSTGVSGYLSWALYLSSSGSGPSNIVADYWTIVGNPGRTFGGAQLMHDPNARGAVFRHWTVSDLSYAIYAAADATGIAFDDWKITRSGASHDGGMYSVVSVVSGRVSNLHLYNSAGFYVYPPTVNGGGLTQQ